MVKGKKMWEITSGPALMNILHEVREERARQNGKWGGPDHDDQHGPSDWGYFIRDRVTDDFIHRADYHCKPNRQEFIEIASLAIAAVESLDRKESRNKNA